MDVSILTILNLICGICSNILSTAVHANQYGYCADENCSAPVAEGRAVLTYRAGDQHKLSVKAGTQFEIFVKSYGPEGLVGIELHGERGYIPVNVMQETKALIPNTELVPAVVEFVHKDGGGQNSFDNIKLEVNSHLVSPEMQTQSPEMQTQSPVHSPGLHSGVPRSDNAELYTTSQQPSFSEASSTFQTQPGNVHQQHTGFEMSNEFLPNSVPAMSGMLQQSFESQLPSVQQPPYIQPSSDHDTYQYTASENFNQINPDTAANLPPSYVHQDLNTPQPNDFQLNLGLPIVPNGPPYNQFGNAPPISQPNLESLSTTEHHQENSVSTSQSSNIPPSDGFQQFQQRHSEGYAGVGDQELSSQNNIAGSNDISSSFSMEHFQSGGGLQQPFDQSGSLYNQDQLLNSHSLANSFLDQSKVPHLSHGPNSFNDKGPQDLNPQASTVSPEINHNSQFPNSEQSSERDIKGSLEHSSDRSKYENEDVDQTLLILEQMGLYNPDDPSAESSQGEWYKRENDPEVATSTLLGSDQSVYAGDSHNLLASNPQKGLGINPSQETYLYPGLGKDKTVRDIIAEGTTAMDTSSLKKTVDTSSDKTVIETSFTEKSANDPLSENASKVSDGIENQNSTAIDDSNVDEDSEEDDEEEEEDTEIEPEEDAEDVESPIVASVYVKEPDLNAEKQQEVKVEQNANSIQEPKSFNHELSHQSPSINDGSLPSSNEISPQVNLNLNNGNNKSFVVENSADALVQELEKGTELNNTEVKESEIINTEVKESEIINTEGSFIESNSTLSTNDSFSERRGVSYDEDLSFDSDSYLNPDVVSQGELNSINETNELEKEDSALEKVPNISDSSTAENTHFPYPSRNLKGEQDAKDNQSGDVLDENSENVTYAEFDFFMQVENSLEAIRTFIDVLLGWMPEPLYSILMDLKAQGVSPRVPVFTAISAVPCVFLIIAVVYTKEKSKEKKLIARLAVVEKNVYTLSAEKNILEENLKKTEAELQSSVNALQVERQDFDKVRGEVGSLQQSINKTNMEVGSNLEEITVLKEREKQYIELVSDHEKAYLELQSEKTQLEKEVAEQDNTIQRMRIQLEENEKESKQLQKEKLEYIQSNEEYEEKLSVLQQNCNQLLKEAEVWNIRVNELDSKLQEETALKVELENTLNSKDSEIESLTNLVQTFKTFEEAGTSEEEQKSREEKLQYLMDSTSTLIKLQKQEDENKLLLEKLSLEKNKMLEMDVELLEAKSECDKLKVTYNQALQDKTEAQTKLEVLTNYFKDKEVMLQKQLGVQEAFRERREKDADSAERQIILMEQENASYKYQVASMKQEMEETERNLKTQIAAQEKKAHENWIAARAAERKLEDMKQEVTQLRQRLTLLEREQEKWLNSPREDVIRPIPKRISGMNDSSAEDANTTLDSRLGLFPPLPPPMMLPLDRPLPPLLHPHLPPIPPPPHFEPPPFRPQPWHLPPEGDFRRTPPDFAHGRESTPPRGRHSAVNDREAGPRQSSPLGEERRDSRNSTPPHSLPDFHAIPPPPRPFFPMPGHHPRYPMPPAYRREFAPGPKRTDSLDDNRPGRRPEPPAGPDSWSNNSSRV